jgi:hypothetical protein
MLPLLVGYGLWVDPSTGEGGIPCLWRVVFGVECPGCGLSRADALLMNGAFSAAVAQNWLIVPVWLVGVCEFLAQLRKILMSGEDHG